MSCLSLKIIKYIDIQFSMKVSYREIFSEMFSVYTRSMHSLYCTEKPVNKTDHRFPVTFLTPPFVLAFKLSANCCYIGKVLTL